MPSASLAPHRHDVATDLKWVQVVRPPSHAQCRQKPGVGGRHDGPQRLGDGHQGVRAMDPVGRPNAGKQVAALWESVPKVAQL